MLDTIKNTRVDGLDRTRLRADLRAKYERGASVRALAANTGRSYGLIHKLLEEAGTVMRSRGGFKR